MASWMSTAATDESEKVRGAAEEESAQLLARSREEAERITTDAREETERLVAERGEELQKMQDDADKQARETKAQARTEARDITSEARVVAQDILGEGGEISRNMRELAVSLHNNAERLLRDVRLTHGGMTARLDQVAPDASDESADKARSSGKAAAAASKDEPGDDLDVPEFIPRT